MRVCTACARSTDESGRFCPECGAAFKEFAAAETKVLANVQNDVALAATGTSMSSATKLLGTVLDGQFKIESVLGGGAFGTVYRGTQLGLDRAVAIKVPTYEIAADPVMAKRFAREARSAARVHHPGIVAIHAVGELSDGRPYLAMQFVEGTPLDQALVEGPLAPVRALRLVRLIASALSETHAADVVHRDLKPTNIMWRVDRNGDDRVTLVDFGIAVCKPGNADATRLTADGLIGTPHYMSPEQASGEQVDARADLYALGCLLHELVTGTPPYEGSGFEVLLAHLGRPAPLPSEKNPNVPPIVDKLCAALMQKRREQRPQSADELIGHIDDALVELEGRPSGQLAAALSKATKAVKRPKLVTVQTKLDLPEGTDVPARRGGSRLALTVAATAVITAAAGFALYELRGKPNTAQADPADEVEPADNDPLVGRRKPIIKDNGEMIAQLLMPDPLVARQEIRSRIELKNKLGQPIVADEIVLTIEDKATGAAKGLTARPRRQRTEAGNTAAPPTPGRYYFTFTFPAPGSYLLRVFPPSIDSSFEIPLEIR